MNCCSIQGLLYLMSSFHSNIRKSLFFCYRLVKLLSSLKNSVCCNSMCHDYTACAVVLVQMLTSCTAVELYTTITRNILRACIDTSSAASAYIRHINNHQCLPTAMTNGACLDCLKEVVCVNVPYWKFTCHFSSLRFAL